MSDDRLTINPYAPTLETAPALDDDSVRRCYLDHESAIKLIGNLYLFFAFTFVTVGLYELFILTTNPVALGPGSGSMVIVITSVFLSIGLLLGWSGYGLRRFRRWARITSVGLATIGLLGIPVGTVIAGYFLYLLLSKNGQFVFSDDYQGVIARTPHIKQKVSAVVWLVLGLAGLVIGAAILFAVFKA
jgi:hypothetical protein